MQFYSSYYPEVTLNWQSISQSVCYRIMNNHEKFVILYTTIQASRKGKNPFIKCYFKTSFASITSSSTPRYLKTQRQLNNEIARVNPINPTNPVSCSNAQTTPMMNPKTSFKQNSTSYTSSFVHSASVEKALRRRLWFSAIKLFNIFLIFRQYSISQLCQACTVCVRINSGILQYLTHLSLVMKEDRLTDNGIDKLIGGVNGVIVQTLAVTFKNKNGQDFYGCELSDGYCKLKGCLVVDEEIFAKKKPMEEYLVIKVIRFMVQKNKAHQPIVVVQNYTVYTEKIKFQIGSPLYYDQFIKNGKKNPEGNNTFEIPRLQKKIHQTSKYEDLMDQTKPEEDQSHFQTNLKANNHKLSEKTTVQPKKMQQKQSNTYKQINSNVNANKAMRGNLKLNIQQQNKNNNKNSFQDNTNNSSRQNSSNQGLKSHMNSNQTSNNLSRPRVEQSPLKTKNPVVKKDNKLKAGPIERVQQLKSSPVMRGNQKRPSSQYNEIKSLFVGMDNFVILARVLFVSPIRSFINKKGIQSSISSIELADRSGIIECTMFGETAQKFQGKFQEDQVFEIANASVSESNYLGHHQLRMSINQMTRVSLKEDDPNVPYSQDFCISISQLLTVPIGQTVRVICLIKDTAEPQNIISKAGKELRKKNILLCDPEQKVQVQVTLWNEKCDITFERQPYMLKGLQVTEYKGNRQYSFKQNFMARILKHHNLRRFIKDIENIVFANPDSQKKKRGKIMNFKDLNNLMDQIDDKGAWSEVICSISTIKTSAKNYYLSCPSCKKKVTEQADGQCSHCSKSYETARARYILQISVCDSYDSVWATAYDEVAQKIVGMTANQFSKLKEQQVQELAKNTRNKEFKLRMVTKSEQYNNEFRKKTSIIKILELNYAEEAKFLLTKLEEALR